MRHCATLGLSIGPKRDELLELALEGVEVDRLGDEVGGSVFAGFPPPLVVTIGRNHDHRQFGMAPLDLLKQPQSVHARHIDVRQHDDQLGPDAVVELSQGLLRRGGEVHDVLALPHLAAEALAKQLGHVRFVIHNHDADAHRSPLDHAARRRRGRRTVNSVKRPRLCFSTSIEPPCCCLTMS